jgi:hypothetical protein
VGRDASQAAHKRLPAVRPRQEGAARPAKGLRRSARPHSNWPRLNASQIVSHVAYGSRGAAAVHGAFRGLRSCRSPQPATARVSRCLLELAGEEGSPPPGYARGRPCQG